VINASRVLDLMASDFFAAEAEVDKAIAKAPGNPALLQLKAYLLNFRKDYVSAISYLENALRQTPQNAQIAFNLAYCRLQSGDVGGAATSFGRLGNDEAQLLAALCHKWLGQDYKLPAGTFPAARYYAGLPIQSGEAPELVSWLNRYDVPGWGELDDKARLAASNSK
jgi:predicted Zn-dependent protease